MKITQVTIIFFFLAQVAFPQSDALDTYYEKSNYKETPRYEETIEYCKNLASSSEWIDYQTFGTSPQQRDLPLLILDKKGNFDASSVHSSGNGVILIEACIHPGEPDGKDAGLMLLRDLAIKKQNIDVLDNLTILFIPIVNVDGHERFGPYNRINQNGPKEMGWRTNAQNLNLNRDFLKADAPEIQQWLQLFNKWMPDFFIDIHTPDG
ncbi:MAG: M14 family zinc carboxypeptidase, partial [Bacteroidales bacterium]